MKKIELSQTGAIHDVIQRIDKGWMLVTAGTREKCNTMTASWGGVGVLWHQPMATIYVRPERYTYELIEGSDYFSIGFFAPEHQKSLAFCGKESGRTVDKIAHCGFTIAAGQMGGVYFEEADLALICKKRYRARIELANMIDMDPDRFYDDAHGSPHMMYMGEVVEVYTKE